MPRTVSATEARVHFGELLQKVESDGGPVIVEKGGKPVAVILSTRRYEEMTRESEIDDWQERARRSRELVAKWLGDRAMPDVDEMINFGHEVD